MPKVIPDLLKDRDKRTAKRKMDKKAWDKQFDLSADSKNSIRLLDEGMVTYSDGSPLFYIKKGTLSKLVSEIKDEYVGSINLGHMDFARFPFILGTWKKKDLTLVDIGDGRQALDVVPHFDYDSAFVKELKRLPYDVAVSAEFRCHIDWELTERYGVEVVDEIYPEGFNFAVVGEPGNVNSAGLKLALKGENMSLEELSAAIESRETTSIADLTAMLDDSSAEQVDLGVEPEEAKDAVEEVAEAVEEAKDAEIEPVEEQAAVETEETVEEAQEAVEEASEPEAEEITLESVMADVQALREQNESLTAQVEALNERVESLTTERDEAREDLAAAQEIERNFLEKFKKLSLVSTAIPKPKKEAKVETKAAYTDGFGA